MKGAVTHLKRAAKVTAILLLSAVHAAFLWRRVADDSLSEPRVLARWLAAVLLVVAFFLVRRTFSRRSSPAILMLWLIVATLHAAVPASDRILDARGDVSLILQMGLAALPAGLLLSAVVAATIARDRRSAFLPIARPIIAWRIAAASLDPSRAPPTR